MRRHRHALRPQIFAVVLVLASGGWRTGAETPGHPWVWVDYGALVNGRALTHSGEPVEAVLARLGGRPFPEPGERPEDAAAYRLLDPVLEPYAFVLADAVDWLQGTPPEPMPVEVGLLWQPGDPQPAWAELLRARKYLVESDGRGRARVFLPAAAAADADPVEVSRQAWNDAWPVLRHVCAALIRAGAAARGSLKVTAYAYRHEPERTRFLLAARPWQTEVRDTGAPADRPALDLEGWTAFLHRPLRLEGARLDDEGQVVLFGAPAPDRPSLLGEPLSLADLAVAYRAVFHGGRARPYMSLDRAYAPHMSLVLFGGRLRDTRAGLVSLLCDIRFKTFSQGWDVLRGADVRASIRELIPGFRTHLEHLAADPRSAGFAGQQTRLWFYPDDVELTLSPEADVLAFRRVRMTAASERADTGFGSAPSREVPPWTAAAVEAINAHYDRLARLFPELADLDQVARLLSLFTWLRLAREEGHALPDLDVLLAWELPPLRTPRVFPQLLAFDALPPGGTGEVVVVARDDVARALGRLESPWDAPLPARERLERALELLDARLPDHQALREEVRSYELDRLSEGELDWLAYRALRLAMHQRVLSGIPQEVRHGLRERAQSGERLRVFSVGIGGLDLDMSAAVRRARGRAVRLGASRGPVAGAVEAPGAEVERQRVTRASRRDDLAGLPAVAAPRHGWAACEAERPKCEFRHGWVARAAEADGAWRREWVAGRASASPRMRRIVGRGNRVERIERLEEDGRKVYAFRRDGATLHAVPRPRDTSSEPAPSPAQPPEGLALLQVPPAEAGAEVELRLISARTARAAAFPRALVQALLLGPAAGAAPALPGLAPLPPELGRVETLMVIQDPLERLPPWARAADALPPERRAARVARALRTWWARMEPPVEGIATAVATDPAASVERWARRLAFRGEPLLVLPEDGFPGPLRRLRERLARGWPGPVVHALPERRLPGLVVYVTGNTGAASVEPLLAWAREPKMKGRLLAVWPVWGRLRGDLPAALLEPGNLTAVGVAEPRFGGFDAMAAALVDFAGHVRAAGKRARPEALGGPFLWFY